MKIYPVRRQFLEAYIPVFERYFQLISGGVESVEIQYETQLEKESLAVLLEESLQRDRASRYTNVGIHKDDLILNIQGHPVKKFGSQGQQKSFIVALRLAQYEYIRELKSYKPIMLLDDIFDKLDPRRVSKMIAHPTHQRK